MIIQFHFTQSFVYCHFYSHIIITKYTRRKGWNKYWWFEGRERERRVSIMMHQLPYIDEMYVWCAPHKKIWIAPHHYHHHRHHHSSHKKLLDSLSLTLSLSFLLSSILSWMIYFWLVFEWKLIEIVETGASE